MFPVHPLASVINCSICEYRLIPFGDESLLGNDYERVFLLYKRYATCMARQTSLVLIVNGRG